MKESKNKNLFCENCSKPIICRWGFRKYNKSFCQYCFFKFIQDQSPKKKCECSLECKEMIPSKTRSGKHMKYKSGHYMVKGINNIFYKGGRIKKHNYWYLLMPDYYHKHDNKGYVLEHVYFYQEYYKCCMLKWGVVHHKDNNPENNMSWNLEGMTKSKHMSLHMSKDKSNWFCLICKSNKTFIDSIGYECWRYNKKGERLCYKCFNRESYKAKQKSIDSSLMPWLS